MNDALATFSLLKTKRPVEWIRWIMKSWTCVSRPTIKGTYKMTPLMTLSLKLLITRYVSWGEYPLSFAAVLGQEECYRLILSRGADHDLVDTNGNSVTHILVVHDNMVSHFESFGTTTYLIIQPSAHV